MTAPNDKPSEVAKSVARALGLIYRENIFGEGGRWCERPDSEITLYEGNVFDGLWFKACVLWLGSKKYGVHFAHNPRGQHYLTANQGEGEDYVDGCGIFCPAEEFPARAVHALLTRTEEP